MAKDAEDCRAIRIGISGSVGSGKTTALNAIVPALEAAGFAVVAVDDRRISDREFVLRLEEAAKKSSRVATVMTKTN